jgi:hypothetical protein
LDVLISLFKDLGIPTAITLIVLLRIEPKLDALTKAIYDLPARIHIKACDPPPEEQQQAAH